MATPWLDEIYAPISFANIPGYPHDMSTISTGKILAFHGDNAISTTDHWSAFTVYIQDNEVTHLDVVLKCFALSMKKDARAWFKGLPNNNISTFEQCKTVFFDRWQMKKYACFLLNALTKLKRKENETIGDFNHRFDKIV